MVTTVSGTNNLFSKRVEKIPISKQRKGRELDVITLRNHAPRSYITGLSVTVSVLDMIIV